MDKREPRTRLEELRQIVLPLIREAYQDGNAGTPRCLLDPAEEIAAYEAVRNQPMSETVSRIVRALIDCMNAAYAQGRRNAEREHSAGRCDSKAE